MGCLAEAIASLTLRLEGIAVCIASRGFTVLKVSGERPIAEET